MLHTRESACPSVWSVLLAHSEPGAGSDVANIQTTAKLDETGEFYIVNGSKKWITGETRDVARCQRCWVWRFRGSDSRPAHTHAFLLHSPTVFETTHSRSSALLSSEHCRWPRASLLIAATIPLTVCRRW